jgi:hypothetical protein
VGRPRSVARRSGNPERVRRVFRTPSGHRERAGGFSPTLPGNPCEGAGFAGGGLASPERPWGKVKPRSAVREPPRRRHRLPSTVCNARLESRLARFWSWGRSGPSRVLRRTKPNGVPHGIRFLRRKLSSGCRRGRPPRQIHRRHIGNSLRLGRTECPPVDRLPGRSRMSAWPARKRSTGRWLSRSTVHNPVWAGSL